MKILNTVPTIIILFISLTAFIGGFLESDRTNTSNDLRQQASELETLIARMETRAVSIISNDQLNDNVAESLRLEAFRTDNELRSLNSTFSGPTMLAEQRTYVQKIADLEQDANYYAGKTVSWILFQYFDLNNNTEPIYINNKTVDGFDFSISKDQWIKAQEKRPSGPVRLMPYNEYLPRYHNQALITYFGYNPDYMYRTNLDIGYFAILIPIWDFQSTANDLISQADTIEQQSSQINLGVSIITVAVILSSAMNNRINDRENDKNFKQLKSNMQINENLKVDSERDLLSLPVLVVAAILSVAGIVIPFII